VLFEIQSVAEGEKVLPHNVLLVVDVVPPEVYELLQLYQAVLVQVIDFKQAQELVIVFCYVFLSACLHEIDTVPLVHDSPASFSFWVRLLYWMRESVEPLGEDVPCMI
jgi:hypothetical protein